MKSVQWSSQFNIHEDVNCDIELIFKESTYPFKKFSLTDDIINAYESPFLYLFISSGDEDIYKTKLKPYICEWIECVKNNEFLLVHLTDKESRLFQTNSVFKSIKSDFASVLKNERFIF